MDNKQSFNLNADFLGGYSSIFMKLIFIIIAVFMLTMIINFLRDKFINKESNKKMGDISELLIILNKLFYVSGFGFVIANILHFFLAQVRTRHKSMNAMNFRGEWDYLTFGIIIIFVGIGFKIAYKAIKNAQAE